MWHSLILKDLAMSDVGMEHIFIGTYIYYQWGVGN